MHIDEAELYCIYEMHEKLKTAIAPKNLDFSVSVSWRKLFRPHKIAMSDTVDVLNRGSRFNDIKSNQFQANFECYKKKIIYILHDIIPRTDYLLFPIISRLETSAQPLRVPVLLDSRSLAAPNWRGKDKRIGGGWTQLENGRPPEEKPRNPPARGSKHKLHRRKFVSLKIPRATWFIDIAREVSRTQTSHRCRL